MGPATCTGLGAVYMKVEYVQGAPHTTSYAGTREFMRQRARVALYNRLFPQSIVTRRHGVGVLLPWGKGLSEVAKVYFVLQCNAYPGHWSRIQACTIFWGPYIFVFWFYGGR